MKDFWCDTIYRMTDAFHLQTYAYIDKGKFKHRTEDDKTLTGGKPTARDFLVLSVDNMAESDRYIYIATNKGRVFYDKKEKKTFAGGTLKKPFVSAKDDLYGGPGLQDFHINDNTLYTFRYPHEFEEYGNGKHSITDARYNAYRKMVEELNLKPGQMGLIINRAPGGMLDEGVKAEIEKHGLTLLGVLPQDEGVYRCDCNGEPSAKLPASNPVKVALKGIMDGLGL